MERMEARDEKRLLRFQKQLAKYKLLIIDELGFVPLSKTGAELLFEVFSRHCHVKRSDFDRLFSVACRDANHLLHTPSIST